MRSLQLVHANRAQRSRLDIFRQAKVVLILVIPVVPHLAHHAFARLRAIQPQPVGRRQLVPALKRLRHARGNADLWGNSVTLNLQTYMH